MSNAPPKPLSGAEKLRALQRRLKLTQIEMAARIGIGQTVLSRYMSGNLVPGLGHYCLLRDFAKRHRVSLAAEDFVSAKVAKAA